MKEVLVIGEILRPSVAGSHDCPSPFILTEPPSPSGSGEGFLFRAARAPDLEAGLLASKPRTLPVLGSFLNLASNGE